MKFRSIVLSLCLVLIMTGSSSVFLSQSQTATISGVITDEARSLVPGVTVTAVDAQGEKRATTVSDRNGSYSLPNLQPGTYTVTAVLPGFETGTASGIVLTAQAQPRLDFTLKIARGR